MPGIADIASLAKTASSGGLAGLKEKAISTVASAALADKPIEKIPLGLYRGLAAFPVTGLLGLDHFAAGSMETAFAKLLINLITFGSWYMYDMFYSIDGNAVLTQGLKVPFVEMVAVQAGRIDQNAQLTEKTKLFLYVLFTCIAGLLCGITYIFKANAIANIVMIVAGAATLAIGAYTAFQIRAYFINSMLSMVPGGALLSKLPGGAGGLMSKLPMMGGGQTKEMGTDFVILGTLFVLTMTGFALSSVRSKSALLENGISR